MSGCPGAERPGNYPATRDTTTIITAAAAATDDDDDDDDVVVVVVVVVVITECVRCSDHNSRRVRWTHLTT